MSRENIAGSIAEAIFPGRRVRSLTISLAVDSVATVTAEIYIGEELAKVAGVIGVRPSWSFVCPDKPPLTDEEREAVEQAIDSVSGMEPAEPWTADTLRGLLARLP